MLRVVVLEVEQRRVGQALQRVAGVALLERRRDASQCPRRRRCSNTEHRPVFAKNTASRRWMGMHHRSPCSVPSRSNFSPMGKLSSDRADGG